MRVRDLSELHLAAVIALATALGGVLTTVFDSYFTDADMDRQSDVQLVQLAIGLLTKPPEVGGLVNYPSQSRTPEMELRAWAVDTINGAASVKFTGEARKLLVDGKAQFDLPALGNETMARRMFDAITAIQGNGELTEVPDGTGNLK